MVLNPEKLITLLTHCSELADCSQHAAFCFIVKHTALHLDISRHDGGLVHMLRGLRQD